MTVVFVDPLSSLNVSINEYKVGNAEYTCNYIFLYDWLTLSFIQFEGLLVDFFRNGELSWMSQREWEKDKTTSKEQNKKISSINALEASKTERASESMLLHFHLELLLKKHYQLPLWLFFFSTLYIQSGKKGGPWKKEQQTTKEQKSMEDQYIQRTILHTENW